MREDLSSRFRVPSENRNEIKVVDFYSEMELYMCSTCWTSLLRCAEGGDLKVNADKSTMM